MAPSTFSSSSSSADSAASSADAADFAGRTKKWRTRGRESVKAPRYLHKSWGGPTWQWRGEKNCMKVKTFCKELWEFSLKMSPPYLSRRKRKNYHFLLFFGTLLLDSHLSPVALLLSSLKKVANFRILNVLLVHRMKITSKMDDGAAPFLRLAPPAIFPRGWAAAAAARRGAGGYTKGIFSLRRSRRKKSTY